MATVEPVGGAGVPAVLLPYIKVNSSVVAIHQGEQGINDLALYWPDNINFFQKAIKGLE
jgi:hypothetical protein